MQTGGSPRERFAALAGSPDEAIDLGLGALLIAAEAYGSIDVDHYLLRLDQIAARARRRLGDFERAEDRALRLLDFLFREMGFVGNHEDYYDRRNSFLNDVLDRRTGIPITLAVVHLEVARRLGLPLEGVGFPGHFLVRFAGEKPMVLDPFFGEVLDRTACERRLQSVFGSEARLEARYFKPAGNKDILVRVLSNLKHVYLRAKEFDAALGCSDRILLLAPDSALEIRDRGLLYEQLECYRAAQSDLERFIEIAPDDETVGVVRERLIVIQREVARLH
jgi:regulator of sirC expression with transglutaminase-like and TPR domain